MLEADLVGCEISWFAPLCDDDYEFLGVPDPALASGWEHCRNVALRADEAGYDNLLLPSNYAIGIDSVAFAAGIAPLLRRRKFHRFRNIRKNSPQAWRDLGQFGRIVPHPQKEIL